MTGRLAGEVVLAQHYVGVFVGNGGSQQVEQLR